MIYFRSLIFLTLALCMSSCGGPTIESIGGIQVQLKYASDISLDEIQNDIDIIESRFHALSSNAKYFNHTIEGKIVILNLPGLSDITSVKRLLEWNRSMRLSYSVESSTFQDIRRFLSETVEVPSKNKPYKASSMIGLVSTKDKIKVETILGSPAFKLKFPNVDSYYWGAERMLGKFALFLESKSSPYINESMFDTFESRQSTDGKEGILLVNLSSEYVEKIGQLTGNDSTYLLHVFHNEVYISKIIKPHITDPGFMISGAFTPKDALVLGTLWKSKALQNEFEIEDIILLGAEE